MRRRRQIWASAILLLLYWGVRLYRLDAFPIFMDESVHLQTVERISQLSPLADVNIGRLFTMWWYALFAPLASTDPLFVVRAVTVLPAVASAAFVAGIAQRIAGKQAGLLTIALLIISPFHHFFERLALADGVAMLPIVAAVWVALHLRRRWRWQDAALCGGLLFVAFGTKFSAFPYLGIPIAAALTFTPTGSRKVGWAKKALWVGIATGLATGLIALMSLILRWRNYDIWSNAFSLAMSNRAGFEATRTFNLERIVGNAFDAFRLLGDYWGLLLIGLALLGMVIWLLQRRLFLFLVLGAPWLAMFITIPQETRYWLVPATLLLMAAAMLILEVRPPLLRNALIGLTVLITFVHGLPILQSYYTDPIFAGLPERDRAQYVLSDASGSPFPALGNVLAENQPQKVLGILSLCQGLRYTYWQRFPIECRRISPSGEDMDALREWVEQERADGVLVILESSPYIPDDIEGELIATMARPTGLAELRVLRLSSKVSGSD